LKKQSQFIGGQFGVSSYTYRSYVDLQHFRAAKNKAKQSQSSGFGRKYEQYEWM
jgi:hypothetical protein